MSSNPVFYFQLDWLQIPLDISHWSHKSLSIYRKTRFGNDIGFWKLVMKSLFDPSQITLQEREFVCISRFSLFWLFVLVNSDFEKYHYLLIILSFPIPSSKNLIWKFLLRFWTCLRWNNVQNQRVTWEISFTDLRIRLRKWFGRWTGEELI